jgi:hypothetical protein
LPPLAAGCLASFVRHGHRVFLHSYTSPMAGVPDGVTLCDAAQILPFDVSLRHRRSGSYALFANFFRYRLLQAGAGLWVDCDVYCLRPFNFPEPFLFGWEDRSRINNAVLKLPPDSEVLRRLLSVQDDLGRRPPWIERRIWMKSQLKSLLYRENVLAVSPWGVAGPTALTWCLRQQGMQRCAKDIAVFYPVPVSHTRCLARADVDIGKFITPRTHGIHLWHNFIRTQDVVVERGSFLDRVSGECETGIPALVL